MMTPTQKSLCALVLLVPPLAASHGCSVSVTNSETVSRTSVPAPAPVLSTRAPAAGEQPEEETDEQAWQNIRTAMGKPGELDEGVLTLVFPRDDLQVTVQGNDVPVGAGLRSEFRFWRCPCGLINVAGQFVLADYEANDVIDALRNGHVEIVSVGPFLIHERPRLTLVRFLGENKSGGALAKTLRETLTWTGTERMAPQKLK